MKTLVWYRIELHLIIPSIQTQVFFHVFTGSLVIFSGQLLLRFLKSENHARVFGPAEERLFAMSSITIPNIARELPYLTSLIDITNLPNHICPSYARVLFRTVLSHPCMYGIVLYQHYYNTTP